MDKILEYLKDEELFVKPLTLIAGIVTILFIAASLNNFVKEFVTVGVKRRLAIYGFFVIAFIGVWLYKRYVFPRIPEGKRGLVFAVTTETIKSRTRLKIDLIEKLNESIGTSPLKGLVQVVLLNNHQSARLSRILQAQFQNLVASRSYGSPLDPKAEKAWERVQKRIRGAAFIFGKITERMAGESTYILESHAFVTLPTIELEEQKGIDRAFASIWTQRIHIEERAEFLGFTLSADLMFIPVAFIMGIAALTARDVFAALKFFNTVKTQTEQLVGIPEIAEVRRKLVPYLSESNVIASRYYYVVKPDVDKMREHLSTGLAIDPQSYPGLLFKSIVEFTIDHDPEKSLETIRLAKTHAGSDGTWRYNEGFLLLHLERFNDALHLYKAIDRYDYVNEETILDDVIFFNEEIIKKDPGNLQSLFILGYLTFKKSGNLPIAQEYFEEFVKKARNKPKYNSLLKEARKCLKQIERKMS